MCDMTACETDPTHYVRIRGVGSKTTERKRIELCRPHLELAHQLNDAQLTKITEYGRLDKAWAVHPGGMA